MSRRELIASEVEKLLHSDTLRGSESLRRLLQYLATKAQENPDVPLKEYQIATEVFGRPANYDPQIDSAVRVQAGRLRTKLSEYYASEGNHDPVLIELPKGSYALNVHYRTPDLAEPLPPHVEPVPAQPEKKPSLLVPALLLLLALSIGIIFWQAVSHRALANSPTAVAETAPSSLQIFWNAFADGPDEPWVIFSNAQFVGRPETGLRYLDPSHRNPQQTVMDHYTGVGEVLAVHSLDRVFSSLHSGMRLKRGSLFTLDDATNSDLIFLGSPSENLTLRDLPTTRKFVFRQVPDGPRKGDLAVMNLQPAPGEQTVFLASPSNSPLTDDYAIVGRVPGLNPKLKVMILAGTTTFGTEAAAEFVCRENSMDQLLSRLGVSKTDPVPSFEALLHVTVKRGVPVQTDLVAVRKW
jgi:hypothetical protein